MKSKLLLLATIFVYIFIVTEIIIIVIAFTVGGNTKSTDESNGPAPTASQADIPALEVVLSKNLYNVAEKIDGSASVKLNGKKFEGLLVSCLKNKDTSDFCGKASILNADYTEKLTAISFNATSVGASDSFNKAGDYTYVYDLYNCATLKPTISKCDASVEMKDLADFKPLVSKSAVVKVQ